MNPFNNPLMLKIRVGSSTIASAIGLSEYPEDNNPKQFVLSLIKKKLDKEHEIEKEKTDNKFIEHGIEYEPFMINLHKILFSEFEHVDNPGEFSHPFFRNLMVAKPDAILISDIQVPVEVKSPQKMYQKIPNDHILQVILQMECMKTINGDNGTPYGHYIAAIIDEDSKRPRLREDIIAVRIFRDEETVKMINSRLKFLYLNYIFEDKIPPPDLFKDWPVFMPKYQNLSEIVGEEKFASLFL